MCRCSNRTMWFMVLSSVNQFDLFWDRWAKIDQGNYCLGLYIVDVWEKISLIIWTSGVTIAVFVACRVLLSVGAATLVVRKGSWLISMRSLSIGLFPGPFWDRRLLKGSPGVHVMNHDGQGGESFKQRGFRSCFRWELVLDLFPSITSWCWTFCWYMFIAHFAQWHGVCVFNNLPHRTFQAKSANQPLCVLDEVSFFLGSFVTDLWCLNPYWAIRLTTLLVDCMRKDRLPSDVYVDLTCKFGDHGLVSPVRGQLIGGISNFDSDALIWIRTPIPFVDPSLLPH